MVKQEHWSGTCLTIEIIWNKTLIIKLFLVISRGSCKKVSGGTTKIGGRREGEGRTTMKNNFFKSEKKTKKMWPLSSRGER